jgi:type IV pilus assembly protein PilO
MPDLRNTRRQLKVAFIVLAVVNVAALAVLLSPLAGSQRARRQQLDMLWKELQQKTRLVEPLRGMDKKIGLAQLQIDTFYKDRLPARDSAIVEALYRVAAQSGVKIDGIKKTFKDPEPVGLTPVEVDAELTGNYLQLVRYVNSLERDQLFFIVNSVELGGQQAGIVKLQIKLETYLKTGA